MRIGMRLSERTRLKAGLVALFLVQFLVGAALHLDTKLAKRAFAAWATRFVSAQLRGNVAFGAVEKLTPTCVWLRHVELFDPQHRRVVTLDRVKAHSSALSSLIRSLTSRQSLDITIESVRADGVQVALLPDPLTRLPSLVRALELDPERHSPEDSAPNQPYRILFSNIEIGSVGIESALPEFATTGSRLRHVSGQLLFTQGAAAASIKRFSLDLNGIAPEPLHAFGQVELRTPARVWGDLTVQLAGLSAALHLDYRDGTADITAQSGAITPELATRWISNWPVKLPVSVSVTAHGPLARLGVQTTLLAGDTRVDAVGSLELKTNPRADLTLQLKSVNLKPLLGLGVETRLDAAARLLLTSENAEPHLRIEGVVLPGRVGAQPTPTVDVSGEYDASGLIISGRSRDPDLPLRAAVMLRGQELSIDAQANRIDLHQLLPPRVGAWGGMADLRARARLSGGAISANVDASLSDVRYGATHLKRAIVAANATGPLDHPSQWDAELHGHVENLTMPWAGFDQVEIGVRGNARHAHLNLVAERPGIERIAFDADAIPTDGLQLTSNRLEFSRGHAQVAVRAPLLKVDDEGWLIEGAEIDGTIGHATLNVGARLGRTYGAIDARVLDLLALSDLLGLPERALSGQASLTSQFDTRTRPATGRMRLELSHATLAWLTNVSGSWEASLNADHLLASGAFTSDLIDEIQSDTDAVLDTSTAPVESLTHAIGHASIDLTRVRLDRIGILLAALRPGLALDGSASLRATLSRASANVAPDVTVSGVTQNTSIAGPIGGRNFQVKGYDALASISLVGETGALNTNWLLARDGQPRAQLTATCALQPIEQWVQAPASLREKWQDVPFEANLSFPRQPIREVTSIVSDVSTSGDANLSVWVRGPWSRGRAVLELQAHAIRIGDAPPEANLDLQGLAEYLRESGEVRLQLSAGRDQRSYAQLSASGSVLPCSERFECIKDWNGQLELGLMGLPIEIVPALGKLGIAGDLRGVISARRAEGRITLDGVVPIDNFRVSGRPLGQTLLNFRSGTNQLLVGAKLIDGGAEMNLEAHVPVEWQHLLPSQRSDYPIYLAATAKGYDAGVLSPWLEEYFDSLEGELDGNIEATYFTGGKRDVAIGGRLSLRRGSAALRTLGLKLSDIALDAQASSTASRTTLTLPRITATVGDSGGNLVGSAVVELDALKLKRLAARLDKAHNVPVSINAVDLATVGASGNVEVQPGTHGYDIDAKFDQLDIKLARVASRQVVGLAEHPDIKTLQPLGSQAWQSERTRQGSTYRFQLDLGKKARIARTDFDLPITGTPSIELSTQLRPSGSVQLEPLGRLQLFGKVFVVEHGQVTFDPEHPTNPRLDVTGSWRGPTHTVTVQIQGTREEARLRWSSDPPLSSESQVLALLLGGGSGDDSTASAGLGVGATLFHEMLSQTALSSLEVRTSADERHANYTAAVPLRENLWFEATYQNPTNTNLPGSAAQRGFSGTVDYRFKRNWSVRTEVGTLGAGADLLWQYRY